MVVAVRRDHVTSSLGTTIETDYCRLVRMPNEVVGRETLSRVPEPQIVDSRSAGTNNRSRDVRLQTVSAKCSDFSGMTH